MISPDFTGYAGKAHVRLQSEISPEELRERVLAIMTAIALDCVRDGAWLNGHVKCIVEDPHEEFLSCSVVGQDGRGRCHGNMTLPTDRFVIIINVLLYGLADRLVEKIVVDDLNAGFGDRAELTLENLIEMHEENEHIHRPVRWINFEEDRQ